MTQNTEYDTEYRKRLEALLTVDPQALVFNHGIERESLRVDAHGNLAQTPHASFLGSKLSHPTITTDFSEAQLELITPRLPISRRDIANTDRYPSIRLLWLER